MSGFGQALAESALAVARALGPTTVSAVAGAIGGAVAALILALVVLRVLEWWRRRSQRVSSLASRGASRAEIARRTGISQDAVGMLLHARGASRSRRNLPLPARIAVPPRADRRRHFTSATTNASGSSGSQSRADTPSSRIAPAFTARRSSARFCGSVLRRM